MVVGRHRRYETDVLDPSSKTYANVMLDFSEHPDGPCVIRLRFWEGDRLVGTFARPGPYGRDTASQAMDWVREKRWACKLPDDGDVFGAQVRAGIRELIGLCYEDDPERRP